MSTNLRGAVAVAELLIGAPNRLLVWDLPCLHSMGGVYRAQVSAIDIAESFGATRGCPQQHSRDVRAASLA